MSPINPVRTAVVAAGQTDFGRRFDASMAELCRVLHLDAGYVVFGHTHWRGSPKAEGRPTLVNTGSWVHLPGLLGRSAADSPYWPGTVCFVDEEGPPRLEGVLDELGRSDLAG